MTNENESHLLLALGCFNHHQIMASDIHTNPSNRMKLSDLPDGASARVAGLQGDSGFCARLREMGFCESAEVVKISGVRTFICQVCGTRVGLNERTANLILVDPVQEPS